MWGDDRCSLCGHTHTQTWLGSSNNLLQLICTSQFHSFKTVTEKKKSIWDGKTPRFTCTLYGASVGIWYCSLSWLPVCLACACVHSPPSFLVLFKIWQLWGPFPKITAAEIGCILLCAAVLLKLAEWKMMINHKTHQPKLKYETHAGSLVDTITTDGCSLYGYYQFKRKCCFQAMLNESGQNPPVSLFTWSFHYLTSLPARSHLPSPTSPVSHSPSINCSI